MTKRDPTYKEVMDTFIKLKGMLDVWYGKKCKPRHWACSNCIIHEALWVVEEAIKDTKDI